MIAPASASLRRAVAWAGVRPGEGAQTVRLAVLLFALTVAFVFAKAAQQGIFLAAHGRERIPDAFVLSAVFLALSAFLGTLIVGRVGALRFLGGLLAAVAIVFGYVGLVPERLGPAPTVLYVLVEVSIGLMLAQSWAFIGSVLDVRSAKRLMPLIGNGSSLGWMIGGFVAVPIATVLGSGALLVASALLLAACRSLVAVIAHRDLGDRRHPRRTRSPSTTKSGGGFQLFAQLPLLRVLAIISIVGLLVDFSLDYQLFVFAQERFGGDPDRIARFMAAFFGTTGAIAMAVQLLMSGRVLSRLGSDTSTLAAPVATIVGSLLLVAAPAFAVIVATRGAYRVLKQALSSPARAQMQGVLSSTERAQANSLIRGVIAPLFALMGGFALKLAPADLDLRYHALATLLIALVGIAASALWLRRTYIHALRRSIDQRRLDLGTIGSEAHLAPEHYTLLEEELAGPGDRAELALTLAAGGDPRLARPIAHLGLEHAEVAVRVRAIDVLTRIGDRTDLERLATVVDVGTTLDERRAALAAVTSLGGPGIDGLAVRHHTSEDRQIRALALAHLATEHTRDPAGLGRSASAVDPHQAAERLASMMHADDAFDREAAAWALIHTRVADRSVRDAFDSLLGDPNPAVRRQAIRTAGHLRDDTLVGTFVFALADPEMTVAAFAAVDAGGDDVVAAIERSLDGAPTLVLGRVASALARGDGPNGEELLLALLTHDAPSVRHRAARALAARMRQSASRMPLRSEVESAVERECAEIERYRALLVAGLRHESLSGLERVPFFSTEVRVRIGHATTRLLALLALVGRARTVRGVALALRSTDKRTLARALELLEQTLPGELAARVLPVLEPRPATDQVAASGDDHQQQLAQVTDLFLQACILAAEPSPSGQSPSSALSSAVPAPDPEVISMVPLVQRVYFLRQLPMFAELSSDDLLQIAEIAEIESFREGAIVFDEGEPGDELYLVMSGRVALRDTQQLLAEVGPEEFFGEFSVLDDEPRSATAECLEDTELISVARPDFEELLDRRSEIGREVIRVLTQRLRETNRRLGSSGPPRS